VGVPENTLANYWQPLDLVTSVTQNGIPTAGGPQTFVGVQSLATKPFSLTRSDATKPWIDPFGGPSKLSSPGNPSATDAAYKANVMDVLNRSALLNDNTVIDTSPGSIGNNPIGTDSGTGYATNPVTGQVYPPNPVKRGDYVRVLAEFWADGPNSETPPGHWHVLANEVADDPLLVKKIGGTGPVVNNLEWDVKAYFSVAASTHDAACAAWALKRYYSGPRPITMIRYMGVLGQSSDPNAPSYNPQGLPLQTNVSEVITSATSAQGGKHEFIWNMYTNSYDAGAFHVGEMAVYSWPGEDPNNLPAPSVATNQSTLRWMLAKDWVPFQRKTFNTPAFPGYVSGHSCFSRSAAEVMTRLTGSSSFPGGFHHKTVAANTMQIDLGPSQSVDLQWTTYYDAADLAGQSRRWGGIHPMEDDYQARVIGSQTGISAYTLADKYWSGSIQSDMTIPVVTLQPNGSGVVTWTGKIGYFEKVQKSTDQINWTDANNKSYARSTSGTFTDPNPVPGTAYRIIQVLPSAARIWNEQHLAAIRINLPNPPAHARNLFHNAAAMYDAWAAYDPAAIGCFYNEKATVVPQDVEAARFEAISYAAYRVLRARYGTGQGAATNLTNFDNQLTALGFSPSTGQAALTTGTTPAELGKRMGQAILNYGATDGFSNTTYPQPYNSSVNPNLSVPMSVLGNNGEFPTRLNMPLGVGVPSGTSANLWQPLDLATSVTQNGIPTPGGSQTFVGVQSLATAPFSLTRSDNTKPWLDPFGGPSKLASPGNPSASDATYKANVMDVLNRSALLNDNTVIDASPGTIGNNPIGTDNGTGYATNPITSQPYSPNPVKRGDYVRVLAEFWADGPNSETPPGHWHVLANEVADDPLVVKKIGGTGPVVSDLEWDIKTYFTVAAASHDAACAAWSLKRYYSGPRPITMIRYMGVAGQSSDPNGPSYNTQGLPLQTGVSEVITNTTSAQGGKHEFIWNMYTSSYDAGAFHVGEMAVYSWPGEDVNNLPAPSIATHQSTLRWMLAKDWVPFQRKTFNTPAFPGYVSGHSCFSRAAAEVMTSITGSTSFPGGFHHKTVEANTMQIDLGPSQAVDLQWNTYYDAADLAGQSRRWGGIHPFEDDFHARIIGSTTGKSVWKLATKYFDGSILSEKIIPTMGFLNGGGVILKTPARRGLYYHLEVTTDLSHWTTVGSAIQATDTSVTLSDPSGTGIPRFYRIVSTAAP
ncbi:MAG: Alkaline phosphatase, partial [Verrucomicrobiaceae bacterium]|nr:Alkaline phosphatase [Verrucomicrobiaceae bacterium]